MFSWCTWHICINVKKTAFINTTGIANTQTSESGEPHLSNHTL